MTTRTHGETWLATLRRWAKVILVADAIALGFALIVEVAFGERSFAHLELVLWTCALVIGAGWLLAMMAAGGMRQASLFNHGGMMDDEELRYLIRPERVRDASELTALALGICGSLVGIASLVGAL